MTRTAPIQRARLVDGVRVPVNSLVNRLKVRTATSRSGTTVPDLPSGA
ncbi:hypothetical protein OG339_42535 [Streptosporangium sp. NBC_01495]|nr:hypothetical protein [Streptosporangium sp. NBC_01495]